MKKLLIIEDDEVFSAGLVRALSRRGYLCMIAASTRSAMELVQDFRPTHVLMDLQLHQESTQELIKPLKKILPHVVLVVLTGNGSIPSAVQAVKDGAASYLTKPATPEAIDQALAENSRDANTPLWDLENDHIIKVLEACGGNISQAAKELGLHRRTLQRRLKKV